MTSSLSIGTARPDEWEAALRLIFQHLGANEREIRAANALTLLRDGELDPDAVAVARQGGHIQAAMICLLVPGASALVWPPQARGQPDQQMIEDRLIGHVSHWLRERGAKLGQTLLDPEEAHLATPLERNG